MMDKAKVKFLQTIRGKVVNGQPMTGDELELFSYFYGAGRGTQFGVAAQKKSVDLVQAVMERITLPVEYHISQVPEFRTCPDTGARQVQYHNTAIIRSDDGREFRETSCDLSVSRLLLMVFLDLLIHRTERGDE